MRPTGTEKVGFSKQQQQQQHNQTHNHQQKQPDRKNQKNTKNKTKSNLDVPHLLISFLVFNIYIYINMCCFFVCFLFLFWFVISVCSDVAFVLFCLL